MKKRWKKKIIACVTALAMTLTVFPQSQLFLRGEKVEAAEGTILTKAEVDALAQPISYQRQSVHDPSIIKNGSDYYVFGSHMGVAKTTDLKNWNATPISDQKEDNSYYGIRAADGTVTKVSFKNAFKTGAYGKKTVTVANKTKVEVDYSTFPASDWNTAVNNFIVEGNMWAPDILYNEYMKKYCIYLSLNGSAHNSVVILLTSNAIEGPYVYEAPIIYSGFKSGSNDIVSYTKTDLSLVLNNGTSLDSMPSRYSVSNWGNYWPHAIDPFVFYDDNETLWLGYGSWSGGIYMIELDKTTGLRDYTRTYPYEVNRKSANDSTANQNVTSDPYFGIKIAGGYYVSGEGAYIEKIGNYYYLFISYGFYSPTGGYNMRIFRSSNPDGPYVDVKGTDAIYTGRETNHKNDSRGLQLMGNYQWDTMSVAEIAQGHNSAFVDDDGNAYVIYHTKFADGTAGHQLRVHQLYMNEDGWIVAAPYEYAGEKVNDNTISKTEIPAKDIIGDYNLIIHKYSAPKASDNGTIKDNVDIMTPVKITLNADGTISGTHTGIWKEKEGTAYATIVIDNEEYKGVFAEQTIDGTSIKTMCFTAVRKSGVCIWGSKVLEDNVIVAYNENCKKMMIPTSTSSNLTLKTQGEFGAEITWSSSNTDLLSNNGKVFPQATDQQVILTKTITKGKYSYQKEYPITIYGTEGKNTDKLMNYEKAQKGDTLMAVSAINANTGVSLTFTETGITSDWTPLFITENAENIFLSVLNYGGENLFESNGTLSSDAVSAGLLPHAIFTDGKTYKVTISYNVDGSIGFYRDDILMLTYGAGTSIGKNTVAGLSKTMASAVRQGKLIAQYPMTDISIGYALDYNGGEIDTSKYLYYQDYEKVSDASTVWKSTNAQEKLTIADDGEHGNYLSYSFVGDGKTNSRGAYSEFQYKDSEGNSVNEVKGKYIVELDTYLKAGSGSNAQESQFAIMGTDKAYSGNNINNGLESGYLLLLSTTNSTTWTINKDTTQTVEIPNNAWVHIKAVVSTDNKSVAVIISNGDKKLYSGKLAINGTGNLYGLYNLAGRYQAVTYIDNIKVYWTPEENTGNITADTEGKLYLDAISPVTVTFRTDGKLSENDTISINGKSAKAGDTIDKLTIDSIDYKEQEIAVHMTVDQMSGWHSIEGSYTIALLDNYSDEVLTKTLEYDLDSLSENSAYTKIATVTENQYTSAYYKVVGTKMYFLTIAKSDKIHSDAVAVGDTTYGWWNGINSELYMTMDGKKYSVGSHLYQGKFANAIGWGKGTEATTDSFENDLIKDESSVVRGYMAFGTFDNDNDVDKGCVLLNVVDLKDINYTVDSIKGKSFTLSGYIGANDGTGKNLGANSTTIYTIPGYSAQISGKAYPDTESEVTVKFQSTGTMSSDNTIKINGTNAGIGDKVDFATVKSITFGNGTAEVVLKIAAINGWHSLVGTYHIAMYDSLSNELAAADLEYELDMSNNTEYEQIKTAENAYSSAYYKVEGTKMYFMTIIKSDKIHCSNITAGNIKYEWYNGIASELYMNIKGKKYSVGSHIHEGKYANAIGWGTGTSNNSFENDLIKDESNVVRGYVALGTFDSDTDKDKGCILLNVVDLKDIGYNISTIQGETFTLSGFLGPNDYGTNGSGVAFVEVDAKENYTIPGYSAKVDGTAVLDKDSKITVTFESTKPINSNNVITINETSVKEGDQVGLTTVESIVYTNNTVTIVLNIAAISGKDKIPGSYHIALETVNKEEITSTDIEYSLELSANTKYKKIKTAENAYSSAYIKIDGTKMYFMTIIKSDKIHCDGVAVTNTTYAWWNGINSELYMITDGKKYSVGSHIYQGEYANAIGWGTGTSNNSFENDLILGKSVIRGFITLGTFDNDTDTDIGCALLTIVDLADIGYGQTDMDNLVFKLSGNLGPNDFETNGSGVAFTAVSDSQYYVVSDGNIYSCTRTYTDPTCLVDGYYTYTDGNGFEYQEIDKDSATGHDMVITYTNQTITISCSKCDSTRKVILETQEGTIGNSYDPKGSAENSILLPTATTITRTGHTLKGWSDTASGGVKYQGEVEYTTLFSAGDTITIYAIWQKIGGPTGTITIAEGKWDSFLTTITFGIYKSKQEEITIDAQAENGIKAVSYLIARDGNSYTEEQLATMDWIAYDSTAKPKLEKNTKNVVYAKLEDQAGNIRYLSSNGIIEDEIAPQITGFDMNVGGLTDHSAELYAEANEDGTYYFVLYKDSEDSLQSKKDSELAEAIIANATKSGAIPAGDRVILSETKLEKATNYNAYIAVRDAAGNASSRVCLFTTAQGMLELTNPTITGFVIYNSDLVADASNTENLKDYSYQWYRSSKPITEDTDFSSLEVIGKAVKGEYTIQREDIGKYLAVTIALEHEVYAGSCKAYLTEPVKPKMVTATATIKDKEYNGTTDAEISELILDGVIPRDQDQVTAIAGDAIFADSKVGNEKEVTVSNVALQGTYASCYQLEQMTIKTTGNIVRAGNAPNMPNAAQVWNVSNEITTVGAITLPKDWIWHADDAEKQLIEGVEITAVAVYNGEDKGNYKVESVEIKIQRSTCAHKETEIRNEKAATCTEAGYTGDTYCLSCNQLVLAGNETSALGHSFTDYKENGDATCTEDGTKTATCERCGETKTIVSEGTKKGHTIVIDPAIEPSCTVIGKTEGKHCSACGEVLEAQKGIAALGHDYESKVTKEPTVTETGIRTYTCKRCDHSYTEEIAKLPEETHKHEYTETITKEPTCTVEGVTTFICSCGDQYTEAIKALGHNYEVVIIKPATVTESGIQRKTCKRCEDTYTEEIPKLEEEHKHQYTETITKEPTCTEKGIKTYVCTCGEQYTEDLEALGHDYKSEITKPATETETGIETFTCTRCDDSYTKEIPKLEEEHKHQYTETITKEPTCTEKGVKTFTCSCGDQYTEDLKALGHDYKSEITKPATITETGIETFTCSRCKDEYTKEIPKLEGPQPPNGNIGNTGSSGGTSSPTGSISSSNNTQTNNNTNNTDNTNTNTTPQEPSENTPNDDKTEDKKVTTETKPDGTKVEIVTETKSDGTTIETVTETKTDGSTISTKEIKTEDESASLVTVVETASDGKVTINSVIRTGVSDTSDTVTIAEELLKDVASDERLDSIVVEITDTTVNSATKESKKTVVNVNIPSVEGVAVEKVVLTKDSIEAAKNIGKGLVVNIINGCAKEGTINNYKVTIPAKQLAKIDSAIQEINVEIVAEPVTNVSDASKKNAITKIVNKNKGKGKKTCVVSLATNKEVKAGMNVTIPVTEKISIAKGSKVYVYRYNAKTGKLIETANCKKTVSGNGTVTIAATSGKDYVISAKKLSGNKVETIKDAISVSVSKKTAKAGKELKMKVSFPNTVSTKLKFGAEKATITYKSSDSKIASVSKAGVITTKRSGTVTIKTTIKLASGQKIVKEQKITIK